MFLPAVVLIFVVAFNNLACAFPTGNDAGSSIDPDGSFKTNLTEPFPIPGTQLTLEIVVPQRTYPESASDIATLLEHFAFELLRRGEQQIVYPATWLNLGLIGVVRPVPSGHISFLEASRAMLRLRNEITRSGLGSNFDFFIRNLSGFTMATGSVKSALQPSSLASRDTKAAINLTSPVPVPGTQLIIEILSLPEAKPQRTANIVTLLEHFSSQLARHGESHMTRAQICKSTRLGLEVAIQPDATGELITYDQASKAIDALSEEVTRTRLASSFEFDIQTNSGILVAIGVVDSGIQAQAIAPTVATRDMTASNNLTAQLPSFPVPGTSLHLEVDFAMQHSKAPTPKIAELIAHFIADLDEWGRAEMKLPEGIIEGDFELRIRPNPGPLGFPDASKIMAELRRIVLDTPIKITFHFNVYNAAGEPVATGNLAVNEGASGKQVANVMTSRDTEPGQELAAPKSDMITARDTAPPPGLAAGNISTPVPVPGNSLNVAVTIPPDAEPLDPTRMSQLLGGLIAHLTHLAQSGTQDMTAPEIWVKGDIQCVFRPIRLRGVRPIWFNEAMGVMQVVKGMVDQGVVRMNFEFVVNIEGFADVVAKGELDVGRGGGGDGGGVGLVAGTESSGAVVPVATVSGIPTE